MGICDMIKIDVTWFPPAVQHELPVVADPDSDDEFWSRMLKDEHSPEKQAPV